jgi:hypothetical protein
MLARVRRVPRAADQRVLHARTIDVRSVRMLSHKAHVWLAFAENGVLFAAWVRKELLDREVAPLRPLYHKGRVGHVLKV